VSFIIGCGAMLVLLRQSALYCLGNCDCCIDSEVFCGFMFSLAVLGCAVALYAISGLLGVTTEMWRKSHQ
jgi:hypothetical protein